MTRFLPPVPKALSEARPWWGAVVQAQVVATDQVARSMEDRWGVGRLPRLVSPETLLRYRNACAIYQRATAANDEGMIGRVGSMMRRAWVAMDAEAVASGHQALPPEQWECLLDDGRVLVIVKDAAAASLVRLGGRAAEVWTLAEVGRVLGAVGVLGEIKRQMPGAMVERVVQRSDSFADDWARDDPLLAMIHGPELER